jgi:hypothetical protein
MHLLARPSRGRSISSSSSHHPCKHGWHASVDSLLPMGIGSGARTPGPRSPKTRGEARDSVDVASPRGGAPFVATRYIRAGTIRPVTGTLEERRSMTCEDPDPTFRTIARAAGQAFRLPPRRDPRVSTAREAFTWMHPETRWSRTFAAYLLSIFKDVHPVGAPLATRSSWRSDEAPRHAALASLWFERAPLEP